MNDDFNPPGPPPGEFGVHPNLREGWPNGETKAVSTMCQELEPDDDDDSEMLLMVSLTRPGRWSVSVMLETNDPDVVPDQGDVRAVCEAARQAGISLVLDRATSL